MARKKKDVVAPQKKDEKSAQTLKQQPIKKDTCGQSSTEKSSNMPKS